MVHGKLFIVSSPDIVIDTDGLSLFARSKLASSRSTNAAADARFRIELAGQTERALRRDLRPP